MGVPLKTELKNWVNTKWLFKWEYICLGSYASVSKPSNIFESGLFQLSGGTSCLFTTSVWQVIERVHVVYAPRLSGDKSHRSVLSLRSKVFPKGCYHYDFKTSCKTGYNSAL